MSKKWLFLVVMVLAIGLVALAGCGGQDAAPPAESETPAEDGAPAAATPADKDGNGVLKIGVLVPTTGSEALYGTDMLNSYQMACDEINEAGGIKAGELSYTLELYPQDDACDTAQASTAASKIVSGDVDFVVGGYCSGATSPCLTQFYDAGLIFLITAANSNILADQGLEQTFVVNSAATLQIQTLNELVDLNGYKKIAIIHQGDDYTQNLSNETEAWVERGDIAAEIVGIQVMEKGAADVSAIVTAVKQSGADLVFWCGYYADGSNVIKQLRQGGYTADVVCGDGSSDPELITGCGDAGYGVYLLSPPYVALDPDKADYIAKFESKFNASPRTYSTLSYDTIYALKDSIERAGSIEYNAVLEALRAIDFDGLAGKLTFTPDRQERAASNFMLLKINVEEVKYDVVK